MWVVKLGGSIMESIELNSWLGVLASFGGGRVVIVPGGGAFANQVRHAQDIWGFNNEIAHRMAILAMEQYGLMMTGIRTDLRPVRSHFEIQRTLREAGVGVWLPTVMALNNPDLPQCWEITSDSLAAWLAEEMGAELLVLVKHQPYAEGVVAANALGSLGIVDALFPTMVANARYESRLMGRGEHSMMERMLVSGTRAGTLIRAQENIVEAASPDIAKTTRRRRNHGQQRVSNE